MFDFFAQIGGVLGAGVRFFVSVIIRLVEFIIQIPKWLGFLTNSVSYLPSVVLSFIVAGILLTVVLLIIGRN